MFTKKIEQFEFFKNLSDPEFEMVHDIFAMFSTNGYKLYAVGGCVRDFLLGQHPKDIDFCTDATPEEMKKFLPYTIDTGIKHGTITAIFEQKGVRMQFEITTFRTDGNYSDHRHPDKVVFTPSLEEDLKRRDFTINSFAYDAVTKDLIMLDESYLSDLNGGIIKCVGDPHQRFNEDALRMLRAIRFACKLGFTIHKDTYDAIVDNSILLRNISKERIRDELIKICCSDHPEYLSMIYETELFREIIPDIDKMINCKQINKYHYTDVFHHTIDVMKGTRNNLICRFAALFHDIGKPYVEEPKGDGYFRYHNHPEKSAELAEKYLQELKFSNDEIKQITTIVKYHDIFQDIKHMTMKKIKKYYYEISSNVDFNLFLDVVMADGFAHNWTGLAGKVEEMTKLREKVQYIITHKEPLSLKDLAIDGNDLIKLGFKEKQIGNALKMCLEYVLEKSSRNVKQTLIQYVLSNKDKL